MHLYKTLRHSVFVALGILILFQLVSAKQHCGMQMVSAIGRHKDCTVNMSRCNHQCGKQNPIYVLKCANPRCTRTDEMPGADDPICREDHSAAMCQRCLRRDPADTEGEQKWLGSGR
ncbi:hypothetical protein PSHT_01632 [Puccinia striiformis]|uniref:Uncharacterized protein n=3 Tax=Puccinia striiformis TaxID=27350 RepID=A0A2S4WJW2_9BASI|nr:hypothetical protein PSHT_01632 [Puccinia striiformis]